MDEPQDENQQPDPQQSTENDPPKQPDDAEIEPEDPAEEPDDVIPVQLEEKQVIPGLTRLMKTMDGSVFAPATVLVRGTEATAVDVLAQFPFLRTVDLSENQIRDIKGLCQIPSLTWLNLAQNYLRQFPPEFMHLQHLQHVNVAQNRLTKLALTQLPSLAYLNVLGNQLKSLEIHGLANLVSIEARQNRIKKVSMDAPNLKLLYLTDNKLKNVKGLEKLPALERLYLRNNELESLDSFPTTLGNLKHLNLRHNLIAKFDSLTRLAALPKLNSIILIENPLCELENYRLEILSRISHINVIDRVVVTDHERDEAKRLAQRAGRPTA